MSTLEEHLRSLQIGEVQRYENLTVFPLIASQRQEPGYLTLDEALKKSLLEVREVDEAGRVNENGFCPTLDRRLVRLAAFPAAKKKNKALEGR